MRARPSLLQYLVGALAGNAPLVFLLFALTFVEPSAILANQDIVNVIILFSMLGGGLLAGFLIEKKVGTRERAQLFPVGMVMGLLCYLLNYILAIISFIPRTLAEPIIAVGFEVCSISGVFLRAWASKQSRKKAAGEH
jgi:hypothetical protein